MELLRAPPCSSIGRIASLGELNSQALVKLPSTVLFRRSQCRGLFIGKAFSNYQGSHGYGTNQTVAVENKDYPRPAEIQWRKELCNSVQLIGVVAAPAEVRYFTSGKVLAWTRMAVNKSGTESFWISLSFWDEMAHVAEAHLVKGSQISVNGKLTADVVDGEDGKQQTYYKVIVQSFNFIERTSPMGSANGGGATRLRSSGEDSAGSIEEGWQAFFASPLEWWDNRKTKRNPNYPDFKHKDTGEALWVEGRNNPTWVKSQLAKLDEKMKSYNNIDSQLQPNASASINDLTLF